MIRLLVKTSLVGGAVGSVVFVNEVPMNAPLFMQRNAEITKDNLKRNIPTTFKSLEDIELFEKIQGCRFSVVQSWDTKKVWSIREFLKHEKSPAKDGESWRQKLITGANVDHNKNKCKEGTIVTLFNGDKGFYADDNGPKK